jgi:polysaccharide chain length determinant protein (PEP-CTERM system associated)
MDAVSEVLARRLRAIWQRRWIAIVAAWVVCAAGWAGVMMIPDQYEASARLYVDADAILTPLLRGVSLDSSDAAELDVLQRTLLSRPNLEKLISKTDLELQLTGPAATEQMVARLASDIRVVPQTRNLFTITYRNASPKLALDVVQNILATFLESKVGNNRADIENAQNFLASQIDNYERQLRDAERKRAEFRTRYIDLLPGDGGGVSRYEAAQASVRQLRGVLEDARSRQAALTRELAATPAMLSSETEGGGGFAGGGGGGGGNARLADAERQLAELRLKFTDEYPEVVALKNLIAAMRSGTVSPGTSTEHRAAAPAPLAPRARSIPNPVYEQLRVRIVENESTLASLERQVEDADRERARLEEIARGTPGLQAEYTNLNRDYDVIRKNYDELLARREQMRIASAADTEANKVKVQIIDPPQRPSTPVAPKRALMLSVVLLAGFAAGVALVLMIAEVDTSFQGTDDLRVFGLPVIGGISVIAVAVPAWQRFFSIGSVVTAMLLLCAIYGGLIFRLSQAGVA